MKDVYEMESTAGAPAEVEELYSDWRETGGLLLPRKVEILRGGQRAAAMVIDELELNTGLSAEELSKRP